MDDFFDKSYGSFSDKIQIKIGCGNEKIEIKLEEKFKVGDSIRIPMFERNMGVQAYTMNMFSTKNVLNFSSSLPLACPINED